MAIRRLGPTGAEIRLPSIAIPIPVTIYKKVDRAEASDGSGRYNYGKSYRVWELRFPEVTKAELDDLIALRNEDQLLRWQNEDEQPATWYNVAITDFKYNTEDPASPTTFWYASMTLEEAV
jgi:hypothetical protein